MTMSIQSPGYKWKTDRNTHTHIYIHTQTDRQNLYWNRSMEKMWLPIPLALHQVFYIATDAGFLVQYQWSPTSVLSKNKWKRNRQISSITKQTGSSITPMHSKKCWSLQPLLDLYYIHVWENNWVRLIYNYFSIGNQERWIYWPSWSDWCRWISLPSDAIRN